MTRKHKCASCIHCEMCKWIGEVKQSGCDFYTSSCDDIAKERYADLCAYFGEAKNILKNRKDFTDWLERIKWYIHKAEELFDKYEKHSEPCEDAISRQAAQAKIKSICDEYRLSYEDGERKPATGGSAYALGHAFDDLPPVQPVEKPQQTERHCEECQHYAGDSCGGCGYPDYEFFEELHTCENCGHSTGNGLFDCTSGECSAHDKWVPIQTDGIKVGDEVEHNFNLYKVVGITESGNCFCVGKYTRSFPKADLKKTGRYFPQIPEALAQASKGGEE